MGKLTLYRLKGATIIETIVSLVIILTVFSIATSLFTSVLTKTASMKKLKARNILRSYAETTEEQKQFFDGKEPVDGFLLKRDIRGSDSQRSLVNIHFSIYDQNNILITEWGQLMISR